MKRIVKITARMFLIIIGLLVLLAGGVFIYTKTAPQFGQPPKGEDLERIAESPHFKDGIFVNLIETGLGSFGDMMSTLPDLILSENGEPDKILPVKFGENPAIPVDTLTYITWYGHSAFLIEMEGKRILIDPMLSESASPVSFGSSRFPYDKPIPVDELTDIDAIILSHDHYDHLDYGTILKLNEHVGHFYAPLGLGSHLKSWGIDENKITELDWWQSDSLMEIAITAAPARHFSGRGITDRNATQWASWVITGNYQNLYFSGDGGYGPHFSEIGKKHGPFDLAMLECGQYNTAWKDIHMMPESSVQAGIDLNSSVIMPIHWGAFKLAVHEWTEPVKRFKAAAERLNVPMVHPFIGERFCLGRDLPTEEWWNN